MVWSRQELDTRFRTYAGACAHREKRLLVLFWFLLGFGISLVLAVVSFRAAFPKAMAHVGFGIVLLGLLILALYIVATARAFHRKHGVFCPGCGSSLVSLDAELELIEAEPFTPGKCVGMSKMWLIDSENHHLTTPSTRRVASR